MTRTLRALPTMLRVGFAESLAYRAEMVVWMLTMTMPLVSLALWSAISADNPIGRWGPRQFAAYFLATLVVRQLTSSWVVWQLNFDVKNGTLARRLMKPVHPLVAYAAENLGALPFRIALCIPLAAIAATQGAQAALGDPATLAIWLASLFGAWVMQFSTMALVGTLAFWVESSTSVFEVWQISFILLSGYVIPLELFPPAVRAVTDVLPFRYMVAFPVETALGAIDRGRALTELGIQAAFAALLLGATLLAWRAGMRRFAAFGG